MKKRQISKTNLGCKYQILFLQLKSLLDLYSSLQRWIVSQKSLFLAKIYVSTGSTWPYFQFIVQDHLYTPFHFKFCTWSVIINPRLERQRVFNIHISNPVFCRLRWKFYKARAQTTFTLAILSANMIYWLRGERERQFKVKVHRRKEEWLLTGGKYNPK